MSRLPIFLRWTLSIFLLMGVFHEVGPWTAIAITLSLAAHELHALIGHGAWWR
jgi:hypothetical protein